MRTLTLGLAILVGASSLANAAPPVTPTQLTKQQLAAVEQAVSAKLVNPNGAQFSGIVAGKNRYGELSVCGKVNSRNLIGIYSGQRTFIVRFGVTPTAQIDLPFEYVVESVCEVWGMASR